jgi:hypothetical protein
MGGERRVGLKEVCELNEDSRALPRLSESYRCYRCHRLNNKVCIVTLQDFPRVGCIMIGRRGACLSMNPLLHDPS